MRFRVLVEHTDRCTGIALARALHDAGFAVATCSGPTEDEPCPVLRGEECSLAQRANVIVSALRDHPEGASIANWLGVQHPRIPLLRNVEPDTVVRDVRAALSLDGSEGVSSHAVKRLTPFGSRLSTSRSRRRERAPAQLR